MTHSVTLALHDVNSFQVFKITVKDQNRFSDAKSGLRALNNVSEMVSSIITREAPCCECPKTQRPVRCRTVRPRII